MKEQGEEELLRVSGGRTPDAQIGSVLLSLDTGSWDSCCPGAHRLCTCQQSNMPKPPHGRNTN